MQKRTALLPVVVSFFLLSFATQAQIVTNTPRATAALDSLQKMAASTRMEVTQKTKFDISAPRMGKRRHVVRGFKPVANPKHLPEDRLQRIYVWKQKTLYLRNGQIRETFTVEMYNRKVLRERRLNGTTTWLKIDRGQDLFTKASTGTRYIGTYIHDGFFTWRGTQYALPKAP